MKDKLIEILLASKSLSFGEILTKSGRRAPYFVNFGAINGGANLQALADCYAEKIIQHFPKLDNLYGPAYKGIALAVATSMRLSERLGREITFTFNRKEQKDHGEEGIFCGHQYQGNERVVIIEDVITGGTSINETMALLAEQTLALEGFIFGVDRMEKGSGQSSSFVEIQEKYQSKAVSIINLDDLLQKLHNKTFLDRVWIDDALAQKIADYRIQYGA